VLAGRSLEPGQIGGYCQPERVSTSDRQGCEELLITARRPAVRSGAKIEFRGTDGRPYPVVLPGGGMPWCAWRRPRCRWACPYGRRIASRHEGSWTLGRRGCVRGGRDCAGDAGMEHDASPR
jgi:hypothetical protein